MSLAVPPVPSFVMETVERSSARFSGRIMYREVSPRLFLNEDARALQTLSGPRAALEALTSSNREILRAYFV